MFSTWNKVKGNEIHSLKAKHFKVSGNKYIKNQDKLLVFEYELLVFCLPLSDDRPGVLLDYLDGVRPVILDLYIRHHVSQLCA